MSDQIRQHEPRRELELGEHDLAFPLVELGHEAQEDRDRLHPDVELLAGRGGDHTLTARLGRHPSPGCMVTGGKMRSTTARLCIASGLILVFLGAGSALAATPIYWPPGQMVAALKALQYPHPGIVSGICRGQTKARHGTYAGFRCRMAWQIEGSQGSPTQTGTATAWVKPLPRGRVCGSTISLKLCQPLARGPLAGDPTVCSANDRVLCLHNAAVMAARRHVGGPGGAFQGQVACEQTGPLTFTCTLGTGIYTVTFTKGTSQWITTVTP